MSYDELEAHFFISLQKIQSLEAVVKDSLEAVLSLEEENVRLELENSKVGKDLREKSAMYDYTLHQLIDTTRSKELLTYEVHQLKKNQESYSYPHDPRGLRQDNKAKYQDEYYPRYSTSLPMEQWKTNSDVVNLRHIVLKATDTFGYGQQKNLYTYEDELHVYAKCGETIIRYATNLSLMEDRNIDFEDVIDDLLYNLKQQIRIDRQNNYGKHL